ncbi:hypothetical protein [Microbacterium sp. 2FI]|uniref:hypothetical protein n=1 Tax=Microbacterium sp. 2FI TaxID=2502193 RepID=UPI002016A7C3|nr:hypothetical protein [Microbacterium sp. 2FI]
MKVDVRTPAGKKMTAAAATRPVGTALRIAPEFVASAIDDESGIETTLRASYIADEGRYLVSEVNNRATRAGVEINNIALRQVAVQQILQAATPHCITMTLDDEDDPSSTWIPLSQLTTAEGKIIPPWMAEQVTRRGSSDERMDVIELLYGAAALSGQPPVKAIQLELGVPHRTASDWVKRARAAGRLEGMSYIVGRQADG